MSKKHFTPKPLSQNPDVPIIRELELLRTELKCTDDGFPCLGPGMISPINEKGIPWKWLDKRLAAQKAAEPFVNPDKLREADRIMGSRFGPKQIPCEPGLDLRIGDALYANRVGDIAPYHPRASQSGMPIHKGTVSFKLAGVPYEAAADALSRIFPCYNLGADKPSLTKWECLKYAPWSTIKWFALWCLGQVIGTPHCRSESQKASDDLFENVKIGKTSFGKKARNDETV